MKFQKNYLSILQILKLTHNFFHIEFFILDFLNMNVSCLNIALSEPSSMSKSDRKKMCINEGLMLQRVDVAKITGMRLTNKN